MPSSKLPEKPESTLALIVMLLFISGSYSSPSIAGYGGASPLSVFFRSFILRGGPFPTRPRQRLLFVFFFFPQLSPVFFPPLGPPRQPFFPGRLFQATRHLP